MQTLPVHRGLRHIQTPRWFFALMLTVVGIAVLYATMPFIWTLWARMLNTLSVLAGIPSSLLAPANGWTGAVVFSTVEIPARTPAALGLLVAGLLALAVGAFLPQKWLPLRYAAQALGAAVLLTAVPAQFFRLYSANVLGR